MPVALLPPITSGPSRPPEATPLTTGPRYVRGRGNSRWHRARAGYRQSGRTLFVFWCGPHRWDRPEDRAWLTDDLPEREPVCGTCVGRALGAGQDQVPADLPPLVFSPRWITPPRLCPGSGSEQLIGEPPAPAQGSVGVCLACGDLVAVRSMGGPWNPRYGLQRHVAGPGLVPACPWHAWQYIGRRNDDTAGCRCGWRTDPVEAGGRRA